MTLIVAHFSKDRFLALSDSRVSHSANELGKTQTLTDHFTKMFAIPYRFTTFKNDGFHDDAVGQVGFAFAGDVLMAVALQAMSSTLLCNMHNSESNSAQPSFEDICEVIKRAARILHEETVITKPRPYEAFIFGFCPTTRAPRLYLLTLVKKDVFEFDMVERPLSEGMTYAAGTGAVYFRKIIEERKESGLTIVFLEAVRENPDPGTGGAIQMLTLDRHQLTFDGVLQASEDYEEAEGYVAGIRMSEFGKVGDYSLGRIAESVGANRVANRKILRLLGYDPDAEEITPEIKMTASFFGMLEYTKNTGKKGLLDDFFLLQAPTPEKGKRYFSKMCGSCFRMTPLLHDECDGAYSPPFKGPGGIRASCIYCGEEVALSVAECISRVWK